MPFQIVGLDNMQPGARQEAEQAQAIAGNLQTRLLNREAEIGLFDRYYRGDHPLAFATAKFRNAFGPLFRELADNWCELVVDAVEERLDLEGFRVGDSLEADDQAWRIWQANGMDASSQMLHTDALVYRIAYTMVGPDGAGGARITVESPLETIVAWNRSDPRDRLAAFKHYQDELTGARRATLWTKERVWRFEADNGTDAHGVKVPSRWRLVDEPEAPKLEGVVPFVPYRNKPRLRNEGRSEIENVVPLQNAANKMLADLLVTSEFHAAPQRWATGLELPVDPETNKAIDPFKDPETFRFFYSEDPQTTFGQFSGADLQQYVGVIDMLVQHIASQTRTPPHYFVVGGEPPSGETIKSAETGLVAKARRKMRHFGEAHEDTIRLAARFAGADQLDDPSIESIWGDPESRTEGEHVDATLKRQALGVPQEQLWEDLGYSPQQRERFRSQQAADRLLFPTLTPEL